jgi:hypothetical protein
VIGVAVLLAVVAVLLAGFVLFFLYSRTPAWRSSDTKMAMMNLLVVIGPMFGMHVDMPPPERPAVMGSGPDPKGDGVEGTVEVPPRGEGR